MTSTLIAFRRFGIVPCAMLAIGVMLLALLPQGTHAAGVFAVNATDDADDGSCDAAHCSLREAIDAANDAPGPSSITFDAGVFPATIGVTSPLPIISDPAGTSIDGGGATPTIDGSATPDDTDGLFFASNLAGVATAANTLRTVTITGFPGNGIVLCGGLADSCDDAVADSTLADVWSVDNGDQGLDISGSEVVNTTVAGGSISDNGDQGIKLRADGDLTSTALTDVSIEGNGDEGADIKVDGTAIGTSVTGGSFSGNHDEGLRLEGKGGLSDLTVSGAAVSGNDGGILLQADTTIADVAISGSTITSNGGNGITAKAAAVSALTITGSTVSANAADGISLCCSISDSELSGNTIEGNGLAGADLCCASASGNTIAANTITANGGDGVQVIGRDNDANQIAQNSTYANGELGIDLVADADVAPGVTENDADDADDGPNDLMNYPLISTANETSVSGTACPGCLVELFLSDGDTSGYGEGETFLGTATADVGGNWQAALPCDLEAGTPVTATATGAGSTSEFSAVFELALASEACATPEPTAEAEATPQPTAEPQATPQPTAEPEATPQPEVLAEVVEPQATGPSALPTAGGEPPLDRATDLPGVVLPAFVLFGAAALALSALKARRLA